MEKLIKNLLVISAISVSTAVQATTYNILEVMSGSSGFGASLFHDATGGNHMSGATLADIPSIPVISGTYDDVTGTLNVVMSVTAGGPNVTLSGTGLIFTGGTLASDSQLTVTFDNPTGLLQDDELGFNSGYVCCGGSGQDPNSFVSAGSDMVMTLWGANFTGDIFNGSFDDTTSLGMDLRLKMSPVPVPAAVWLFGSGLLGLVGVARRRQQ